MLHTVVAGGYVVGVTCWGVVVGRHLRQRVGLATALRILRRRRVRRVALGLARRRLARRHPVLAAGVGTVVRATRLGP